MVSTADMIVYSRPPQELSVTHALVVLPWETCFRICSVPGQSSGEQQDNAQVNTRMRKFCEDVVRYRNDEKNYKTSDGISRIFGGKLHKTQV